MSFSTEMKFTIACHNFVEAGEATNSNDNINQD